MTPCRVLLVDDHILLMEGVRGLITTLPQYNVVGMVTNGPEAVEYAQLCHPHIVIMDISMPKMNGVEATRTLHTMCPQAKVIIYTMYADQRFLLELMEVGIMGHVLKEDPPHTLLDAMEQVRCGRTYFSHHQRALWHLSKVEPPKTLEQRAGLSSLSKREREIFTLLAEGMSTRRIAEKLHISPKTVEAHRYNICSKLQLDSLGELIKCALRLGIITV